MHDIIVYTDAKTTAETLLFARELGATEATLLFEQHDKGNDEAYHALKDVAEGLMVRKGLLVRDAREAQKHAQRYDTLVGAATRDNVESRQVGVITRAEVLEDKDKTHRRGSGMNQVVAKLLADKKKTYAYDLSLLLNDPDRAKILGRMQQNKRILRKYDVAMTLCSFAKEPLGVRAEKERKHFLETL